MALDRSFKDKVEELRVELATFEGKQYVGIRVWWQPKPGEWAPGKAGVTVRAKELRAVVKALAAAAAELDA